MKILQKLLVTLMVLMMLAGCAAAEKTPAVAAVVNGEEVLQSEVDSQLVYYTQLYSANGVDTSDETIAAYLADIALTAAVSDRLLVQDMTAQGVFTFTEDEATAITAQAENAYAIAIAQIAASYKATDEGAKASDDEAIAYAQSYVDGQGYTLAYLQQYYQNDAASQKYADLLMEGEVITDEDVQTAYDKRVAESKAAYEDNVSDFETALNNNTEVWYVPAGYRNVLQILIRSDADDKLADTADKVAEIYAKLAAGDAFTDLIRTYGEDSAFDTESFFDTGYMVNKDSVMWEDSFIAAVFGESMQAPGDYTQTPVVSDMGVHILYYLSDHPSGAVELTEDVKEALRDTLYGERSNERVQARLTVLQDEAAVQLAGAAE